MIGSMWSCLLFCIFDDIVTVAGYVIINTLSCYLNYLFDVTCLFKKIQIFGEPLQFAEYSYNISMYSMWLDYIYLLILS